MLKSANTILNNDLLNNDLLNNDLFNNNLEKKTKLNNYNELLNKINSKKSELSFGLGHDYEFYEFVDVNLEHMTKDDLFFLNINNFINKLSQNLKKNSIENIEIEIYFNTKSDKEYMIIDKIKNIKTYGTLIKIFSNNDFKCFEIGVDYSELLQHELTDELYDKRYLDKISASIHTDNYYNYCLKELNFKEFMEKFVFETLIILYSYLNDKFTLAKIIYYKSNKKNLNIKKDFQYFNKILNYLKDGTFDLELFFEKMMFINDKGETINYDEFVLYLKNELNIQIEFISNTTLTETKYFERIINNLENKNSHLITIYRKIYCKCLDSLIEATEEIIRLTNKNNQIKDNLSEYIRINFK